MMIPKIPINYYPLLNSGHTLMMDGKLDPGRMYCNKIFYSFGMIGTFPDFDNIPTYYTEYILLQVNGSIDYNVLTSLN